MGISGSHEFEYYWLPDANNTLNDYESLSPVAKPLVSTIYVLKVEGTCYSKDTSHVYVEVLPIVAPNIEAVGDILFSNGIGFHYQWFLDGSPILGAVESSYIIHSSGIYYLKITDEAGCSSISEPINLTYSGIHENELENIGLYPNPNAGKLFVKGAKEATIQLYNFAGQLLLRILSLRTIHF